MAGMAGLYQRYQVKRTDGKDDAPDQCYFVLKLKKGKKHEIAALRAYAKSCKDDLPELSRDLLLWAKELEQ